jgi:hypothetical protein
VAGEGVRDGARDGVVWELRLFNAGLERSGDAMDGRKAVN